MPHVGLENGEFETAFPKSVAVVCVLIQDFIKMGDAEIDGGQTVSEVASWNANDCACKQTITPEK